MTIKNKNQRIGVFIDVQNLYHSAKNLYDARVNFKNLLLEAVAGRQLIRAVAYVAKADEPGEASFFDALEKSGIEVRIKDLQVYSDGTKKGDWDVGLAIDAVRMNSGLDTIVLVSGDGDFIPLVEYLKALGKYVEVMAFGKTTSSYLKEIADEFFDIDSKTEDCLLPLSKEGFYKKIPKIIKTTLKK
ncbi:MAG: NYN domain-containing protein [Candidatus Pacebacteria bacterium]|nr:NYN domain-containing protein [Candidatus Paceibacterota bacterium]